MQHGNGCGRVPAALAIVLIAAAVGSSVSDSSTGPLPAAFGTIGTAVDSSQRRVFGNSDMGILQFGFPIALGHNVLQSGISFKQSELWVYLRVYCSSGSAVSVRGFGGLFPSDAAFTTAAYFYKQPIELQPILKLSVIGESAFGRVSRWPLVWKSSNESNSHMGLWPLVGPRNITGKLALHLEGYNFRHMIPMPLCAEASSISGSGDGVSGREPGLDGVWNVVTTTDPNNIPLDMYSRLLLLHHKHHQQMGFQGTLLRCNQREAQELAAAPQLQTEIAAKRLIIWPWIWPGQYNTFNSQSDHSPQPYFWQVPKNQLSMLAGYGKQLRLAYFDLDEYLVLPPGTNIHTASCNGRPMLDDPSTAVWSMPRYAALFTNCTGEELTCWQQANTHLLDDDLLPPGTKDGQPAAPAVTGTTVQSASHTIALPGTAGPGALQLTQCPCLLGKSILHPTKVENTKVHKTTPVRGQHVNSLGHECGYLLHMQALISSKRPWERPWDRMRKNETLVSGQWVVDTAGGPGSFVPATGSPAMLTGKECLLRGSELLRRCTQS